MIRGADWRVGVEAETVLDDLQALERRLGLKRRDGDVDHVMLLVADTRQEPRVGSRVARPSLHRSAAVGAAAVLAALREARNDAAERNAVFL